MWRRALKKEPGWLAVAMSTAEMRFALGRYAPEGKSVVTQCGVRTLGEGPQSAERLARELRFDRLQCLTVLEPREYQLLLVDAPAVPQAELRSAIRWRIKDMLDYHVDDATIDVLDIPPEGSAAAARSHSMYAVAARNETIKGVIKSFEDARIPLSVIDIPETAQRNVAALFETEGQGLALLHFEPDYGLLTINYRSELYLARRIELGLGQIASAATGEARENLFNRVVLELQRTFDHFERQYRSISVTRLLLGPEPEETGLLEHVRANLGMSVERVDLDRTLAFGAVAPSAADRSRLFHLIGASLRHELKTL